jgi:DNA-directed RNA polymerase subunit RPC12/RpoP
MADNQLIYNCPGCGKPSQAPEGAYTNRCEYCALVVRIGAPGRVLKYFYESKIDVYGARMAADRYLKANGLPLTCDIKKATFYYLPFYRFRGMALDYLDGAAEIIEATDGLPLPVKTKPELKAKDFDVTIPAFDSAVFSLESLGIRPQSVPLYAFRREEIPSDTIIVKSDITPQVAEDQAVALHHSNIALYNKTRPLFSAMIGEQISRIYFPVWALTHEVGDNLRTVFIDGLAKRGYSQIDGEFNYNNENTGDHHSYFIRPLKHQCPNCGADLNQQHFSLFYPCKNCGRSYLLKGDGYIQVNCLSAKASICAPYWRFPLEIRSSRSYKTVQDFSNLLTAEITLLRKEKRNNCFYLYSPAFKSTNAGRLTDKALMLLRTQPHDRLEESLPSQGPVLSIEEAEAKQMAVFLWQIMVRKNTRLQKNEFMLNEDELPAGEIVWLPMQDYQLIGKAINYKEVNVVNK